MKTSQSFPKNWEKVIRHLTAIISLPVIGLYRIAYWLMGKRCTYRWGEADVRPVDQLTENQYLFTRLFPAFVPLALVGLVILIGRLLDLPIAP